MLYGGCNDSEWWLAFIMHNLYTKLRGHPYIRLEEEEEGVENPVHDKRVLEINRYIQNYLKIKK